MKILNTAQIREADRHTIAKEPITSIALMERAALACMNWIVERYDPTQAFSLLCGTGNNGGDGLALYRLLTQKKYNCVLYEFELGSGSSKDYAENRKRIQDEKIIKLTCPALTNIPKNHIIIDALLGTGLNRTAGGNLKEMIEKLNALPHQIISIDVPSGLFTEFNSENPAEGIVQAHHTLSFQCPKLAFLLPEMGNKVGEFHLLDIGLYPPFLEEVATPFHYLTAKKAKELYRPSKKFDHKGTHGHLLLIAGSKGKMGAAFLAAKAALRAGSGKLSVLTPQCGVDILQNSLPEAMIEANSGKYFISGYYDYNYMTVSLGPGMGITPETEGFLNSFFEKSKAQMIIDADAINVLAMHKKWMDVLPKNSILTPHPKEFERLIGPWKTDQQKLERLTHFAQKHEFICILKGAHTAIALPDGTVWFNSTGNPGMATAGSGDVLTGIVGGLLARGYSPESAAILGVYAHGKAADDQTKTLAPPFLLASDLIEGLNTVWRDLEKNDL